MYRLFQIQLPGIRKNRFRGASVESTSVFGFFILSAAAILFVMAGVLGQAVRPGLLSAPAELTSLIPVSHTSELFDNRAIERAGDRFIALVGADFQSRLLHKKAEFALESASTGGPNGGDVFYAAQFPLALIPDRPFSKRMLRPLIVRNNGILSNLLPNHMPGSGSTGHSPVRDAGRAANAVADPGFTIEFICYLKRTTSDANDASDASSSLLIAV